MTIKVVSLGWGVQSFTLLAMVALNKLEPIDCAIHSDTGHESSLTYEFAKKWTPWLENHGIKIITMKGNHKPFETIKNGNHISIPAYLDNGGRFSRQCTTQWKIRPFRKGVSQELLEKQLKKSEGIVEAWIGISLDEFCRAKNSSVKYIKHRFPLLELGMNRDDCKKYLLENNLEIPPKSSCVFCPLHNKNGWIELKKNKNDWEKALEIDKKIRYLGNTGNLMYIHSKRQPLDQIDIKDLEKSEFLHVPEACTENCWI